MISILEHEAIRFAGAQDLARRATGITPRRLPSWAAHEVHDPIFQFTVAMASGIRIVFASEDPPTYETARRRAATDTATNARGGRSRTLGSISVSARPGVWRVSSEIPCEPATPFCFSNNCGSHRVKQ